MNFSHYKRSGVEYYVGFSQVEGTEWEVLVEVTKKEILDDLKRVYTQDTAEEAKAELEYFLNKHSKKYPKLRRVFDKASDSLYSFYDFPKSIRSSIYTSNLIENNNKGLKHKTKTKEQFPNEDSLERFICGPTANITGR